MNALKSLKIWIAVSIISVWNAVFAFPVPVRAEENSETLIRTVSVHIEQPLCGTYISAGYPQENGPVLHLKDEDKTAVAGTPVWIRIVDYLGSGARNPYDGPVVGGEEYLAYVTIRAAEGFHFSEATKLEAYNLPNGEGTGSEIISVSGTELVCLVITRGRHDWDPAEYKHQDPTCVSEGYDYQVCSADASHTETTVIPVDPSVHDWGEWFTVTEPSTRADGLRKRICTRCKSEDTQIIPRIILPYTKVYEPDTSWAMSATVAWQSDQTVLETAGAEVRPATAFVWLDSNLHVYDRDGVLISDSIDSYVAATREGMIPAFYIRDAAASSALKLWLQESGLADCFVVSDPAHSSLVKDVADLTFVRGMLDYTALDHLEPSDLTAMVAAVNGAHGKVILLSQSAADRDTVHKLQSLAATVWVKTETDSRSLLTVYTSGVNGVLVDDYAAALDALEFFHDDAPTLLRLPLIIGHRGDPSVYVENTLDSAKGAFGEGADSVENDIQLSADGRLMIFHDVTPVRLLDLSGTDEDDSQYPIEHYTLEEIQSQPMNWDKIIEHNEVRADVSRDGALYGQVTRKRYTVPTFDDYLKEFKDTGLVHDTEIKSTNPDIIPVFKELVDRYDAWDQVFCITFNKRILNAIYRNYPEISIGMLCNPTTESLITGLEGHYTYQEVTELKDAETALMALYSVIDQWNATYNPSHAQYGEEMVKAGRHRGLTVWPWTYFEPDAFSRDFLNGVHGMTVDNAWILSDHIKEIQAEDITVSSMDDIRKPKGITRTGKEIELQDAKLVTVEKRSEKESLVMWRYRAQMDMNGENFGSYYLYSAPFSVTVDHNTVPEKSGGGLGTAMELILIAGVIAGTAGIVMRNLHHRKKTERS